MSGKLYFPDIQMPMYPLEETYEDTSITSKFEDGSMQSRSKFTRSRRTWTLKWGHLTTEDYEVLVDFVRNKAKFAANTFLWKHNGALVVDASEVEARIVKFEKWSLVTRGYWAGSITLMEV